MKVGEHELVSLKVAGRVVEVVFRRLGIHNPGAPPDYDRLLLKWGCID